MIATLLAVNQIIRRTLYGATAVCNRVWRTVFLWHFRPSVRLSVIRVHYTVTKRNNRLYIYQYYMIERWFQFLEAKFRGPEFRGSLRASVLKTG